MAYWPADRARLAITPAYGSATLTEGQKWRQQNYWR